MHPMTTQGLTRLLAWIGLLGVISGCGSGPKLNPVTGTVKYKGNAVPGATVTFRLQEAKNATMAIGTTDAQGQFELTTYQAGKGAAAGKYKVTVTKFTTPGSGGAGGASDMKAAFTQKTPVERNELPAKYADRTGTPLEKTVVAGKNDFPLDLTD
jgi:hypothetical protein